MINADMRTYNYFTLGEDNGYGQPQMPGKDAEPVGQVKMAIYTTSQYIQDNINYSGATYLGLTNALLDDTYLIEYGEKLLKVLYVQPRGRMRQVFMAER